MMNKEEIFTRWQDPTIEKLQQENKDLQQRIDKAKDKIKELYEFGEEWCWDTYKIKDYVEEIDEILGGKE